MINIVIPMAGLGKRFVDAGYADPKPFIDVMGKPMIQHVMENLESRDARFTLIARKEHVRNYDHLIKALRKQFDLELITIEKLTEGTACTVLFAKKIIDSRDPLLIANSDQIVDFNCQDFLDDAAARKLDGSILTFIDKELNPKWSFAQINGKGEVVEVQEKKAISQYATVGIYYFTRGEDFVDAAIEMIISNDRVNNEFYTCPVYNYMVKEGKHIGIYNIEASAMHGTGTPEDLREYISTIQNSFL